MTPEEEEAIELRNEYLLHLKGVDCYNMQLESYLISVANRCALIAVKYRIEAIELTSQGAFSEFAYYNKVQELLENT